MPVTSRHRLDTDQRSLLCAMTVSFALHGGVLFALIVSHYVALVFALIVSQIPTQFPQSEFISATIELNAPAFNTADDAAPIAPQPEATPFATPNPLTDEMLEITAPEFKKLNAYADLEEGGTELRPEGRRSGGGGGDDADSPHFGHIATDDKVWARMKWKPDPGAKDRVAGDESGRGTSVPGTLKNPGAGDGLGNGSGSGALASVGSGTGSGVGANGSNIGTGLGKAPSLGSTRRPEVLSMNQGTYPPSARNARQEGTVVLNVEVLASGEVGRVDVRTSSGYTELDRAALTAAREWKFTGAIKDGQPVAFWYAIPFRFVLTEY